MVKELRFKSCSHWDPVQLIGNCLHCGPSGTQADGAHTILRLLVTIDRRSSERSFNNSSVFGLQFLCITQGQNWSHLPSPPPSTCPVAGHAVSCQLLQECLRYIAASLPRAAHIQWLLQGRVPRPSHSDPHGTMLIAMLASEIPVGSAQPAVGQLHFSLCPVVLPSPPFHRVTPKMVRSRNIPQGALRITSLTKVSRGSTHTQEGLKSEQW